MRFPFTFPVTVGDLHLADVEGVAIVDTRHELHANRGTAYWHIAGLLFEARDAEGNRVSVPMKPGHDLYRPICLWLLQHRDRDIHAKWVALNIETVGRAA